MNKEFLNICYKFFNRFITVRELIDKLSEINVKEINDLVVKIRKIDISLPNSKDEYVIKKKEKDKSLIDKLDTIPRNDKDLNALYNAIDNMKNSYDKEIDSYERWLKVFECISQNDYFNNCFDALSDYELLKLIAEYIKAPFPPQLDQKEFDKLVKVGIEHDEREWLWRLAFNYEDKDIKIDSIINYFIKVKDGYYLVESISAFGESLDINKIVDKINDKDLIKYLEENRSIVDNYLSDEQFNKLMSKIG